MKANRCVLPVLFALGLLVGFTGCATTAMKGTPFYTGEWEERTGPVEDRVALWPLVYYREPALSVLWPIFEMTPDHIAVRPVYSVRGREQEHQVHRLLWPLGEFDNQSGDHRFFPVYWGDDYTVVFPLYWRFDEPFGDAGGTHAIFPLWIYSSNNRGQVLHLAWPLVRFQRGENLSRNRVFPLFTHGNLPNGDHWFRSIPYGHEFYARTGESHQWLLPFFARKDAPDASSFYSLPYISTQSNELDARYVMLGLWGRRQTDNAHSHWLAPFYWARDSGDRSSWMAPLVYRSQDRASEESRLLVFPLWYGRRSPESSAWFTPLGGGTRHGDGSSGIYTLPYTRVRDADGRDLAAVPLLLSWRDQRPERTDWRVLAPLSRFSSGDDPKPSYLLPFYFRNPETNLLLTPVYQHGRNEAAEAEWNAVLPFFYQRHTPETSAWITPLGALTRGPEGTGRTLTPLYARVEDQPGHVLHAVPPLLSWRTREPGFEDQRWLLGLARFTRGEHGGASHVIPFYYRNVKEDGARDTRYLLGLGRQDVSAEGETNRAHLLPLFSINRETDHFLSPAYATWQQGRKTVRAVPPLLSWSVSDPGAEEERLRVAAGLYGHTTCADDGERLKSHLFPLWVYERESHMFTPVFGRDAEADGYYRYWLTPLLGTYRNEKRGGWLWPLVFWRQDRETGHHDSRFLLWGRHETGDHHRATRFFPLFSFERSEREHPLHPRRGWVAERDRTSLVLLYQSERTVTRLPPHAGRRVEGETFHTVTRESNRLFPLWNFRSEAFGEEDGPSLSEGSVLWRLYDSRVEEGSAEQPHEYVRRRVLWRAWHYERLNGDVSVDSLPFITYDRKTDGFRRVSFLWRAFRYETHPEEGTKLDLLFLPLRRGRGTPSHSET